MSQPAIYDFAAIGIGPFNLGLACLTRPIEALHGIFLDRAAGFDWHPGLLLPGVSLQTPFLADLVSLADPTHPLSFLNFLKLHDRLYPFYIREDFFVLRREYNQYCQWAAAQCPGLYFGHHVEQVDYDPAHDSYHLRGQHIESGLAFHFQARKLVLGCGTIPWTPPCCGAIGGNLIHSADYLRHKPRLQQLATISVIGGGQSAAEIYYDLLHDQPRHGYRLLWITRSARFIPMEYTRLTLEMTSPDYIDYFFALPPAQRDQLLSQQAHLYKGINSQLIDAIYKLLYQHRIEGHLDTQLYPATELVDCQPQPNGYRLQLQQTQTRQTFQLASEAVILATGYQAPALDFLAPIRQRIRYDPHGRFEVARNYSIDHSGGQIFVQNAELHSHGLASPDLGMGCYRNASIIQGLLGHPYYSIEQRIAFQRFAIPTAGSDRSELG